MKSQIWSNGKKIRVKREISELHSGVKVIILFLMAKKSASDVAHFK